MEGRTATGRASACALGAGGVAVMCKGMIVGALTGGLALAGIQFSLVTGSLVVLSLGIALGYFGFRFAGRTPTLLALGGLLASWAAYFLTGYIANGTWQPAMFSTELWQDPVQLAPVIALYLAGWGLLVAAAIKAFARPLGVSPTATGAGIFAATLCTGGSAMGVASGLVVVAGGAAFIRPAYYVLLLIPMAIMVIVTLVRRRYGSTLRVIAGGILAYPVPWMMMSDLLPEHALVSLLLNVLSFGGMAIMFMALFQAYRPLPGSEGLPDPAPMVGERPLTQA